MKIDTAQNDLQMISLSGCGQLLWQYTGAESTRPVQEQSEDMMVKPDTPPGSTSDALEFLLTDRRNFNHQAYTLRQTLGTWLRTALPLQRWVLRVAGNQGLMLLIGLTQVD